MHEFIAKHREQITGTLSGFDRLVFRGTLRSISHPEGMMRYLSANRVLLKDFESHVKQVTAQLKAASTASAEAEGRPTLYLESSSVSKEEIAREIAVKNRIRAGLICVISCVEPCWSFEIYRDRETKMLVLKPRSRKCLFLYHYRMDPVFGFMNARIQTWFPFPIQICLNGREWLARQMDAAGIKYVAQDNCFPWIEDWTLGQQLMNQQLGTDWPVVLDHVAEQLNPIHGQIFEKQPASYYWSTYQSEWAIDVVFRQAKNLRRLYPRLLHHGITTFSSSDVMRYLGKRVRLDGQVPNTFNGEIVSDLKEREEGVRLKHTVNGNSVKLYDKAFTHVGTILRAETTLQNGSDIRVYRPREGDPEGQKAWRPLRRGIADLHRRAEVSRRATERYLDAYASVDDDCSLQELLARLRKHTEWRGRRIRALNPLAEDLDLFQAISRGEFVLNGFRNRDLQAIFFRSPASSPKEARRRSAWVTRKLRLLRAHSLITKVPGTHRYRLTSFGRKALTAILTAMRASIRDLTSLAA